MDNYLSFFVVYQKCLCIGNRRKSHCSVKKSKRDRGTKSSKCKNKTLDIFWNFSSWFAEQKHLMGFKEICPKYSFPVYFQCSERVL